MPESNKSSPNWANCSRWFKWALAGSFAVYVVWLVFGTREDNSLRDVWLSSALILMAVALLASRAIYANISGEPAAIFISAANPVSDLLLLCLLLGILGVLGWRADRMWWLMLLGFFMLWITDSAWLLSVADDSYSIGVLIDIGWPAGFLLIAFAAWQRRASSVISDLTLAAATVPIFVTSCSFALLVTATQQPLPTLAVALAQELPWRMSWACES